jgi:hypothetical protein
MRRHVEDLGQYRPYLRAPGLGVWKWDKKLSLRSKSGILRIGFWGCGSAFAVNQYQSNMVVIKGDTSCFIDLGSKLPIKLGEFGLSVHDVKNLVVTHSHADHVGGVEELGLKRRYEAPLIQALEEGVEKSLLAERVEELRHSGSTRVPLFAPHDYAQDLWGQTLRGGMAHSEEVDLGGPTGHMTLGHFFDLKPPKKIYGKYDRDAWEFTVGEGADKIHFLMYVGPHIPDTASTLDENFFSAGFVIDNRVMISGDTRYDPAALTMIGRDCETIFNDCQSFPGGVHVNYEELCKLPADVRKRMYLYHCDDGMRPLNGEGMLGGRDVAKEGFAGFAEPIPTFYEWD